MLYSNGKYHKDKIVMKTISHNVISYTSKNYIEADL